MTNLTLYASLDDAAIVALTQVIDTSRREDLEYGGLLFRGAGGYGYTFPRQGGTDGVRISDMIVPAGTVEVGSYHTHGDYVGPVRGANGNQARGRTYENAERSARGLGLYTRDADMFSPDDITTTQDRLQLSHATQYRSYLMTPYRELIFYELPASRLGRVPLRPPQRARAGAR